MTDAGWAEKKAKAALSVQHPAKGALIKTFSKRLKAEHARSVRIVKAEIRRVKLDQHTYNKLDKEVRLDELNIVLTALQRGREGKGCYG